MFRKDKQFLLHMWHPLCYSIKIFDQRKDRNPDQGNVLMAYKVVRKAILKRDEKLKYFDGFFKGTGYEYDGKVFVSWVL
jgi:hypothetical protein